jgi:hypothetical protein
MIASAQATVQCIPVRLRRVPLATLQQATGRIPRDEDVLSYLPYPKVYLDYAEQWPLYENTWKPHTTVKDILVGPGSAWDGGDLLLVLEG